MSAPIGASLSHTFGDVTFDVPPTWREEVLAVMTPSEDSEAIVLRVSRLQLAARETIASLASRRLVDVAREHPRAEVIGAQEVTVKGRRGLRNDFRWQTPEGEHAEVQCFIAGPPGFVFLVAGTAEPGRRNDLLRRYEELLHSLDFDDAPDAAK